MKKILCTIGPSSLNEKTIKGLEDNGCSLFRINLSHTRIKNLENVVSKVREFTDIPICFDSEGAQVRTTKFNFDFKLGHKYTLTNSENSFSIRPFIITQQLNPGDLISVDFNTALVKVLEVSKDSIIVETVNAGKTGENKAVTIIKDVNIPAFSQKDFKAFRLGTKLGIKNYALSFASNDKFVQELRALVPKNSFIISKIESNQGVKNLLKIIHHSDAILIDRGDLSREVSFEKIPVLQKLIIEKTRQLNKDVFVATNQSGIARGYYSESDVILLHEYITKELKSVSAHIDEFFFSPYHPQNTRDYLHLAHLRKPDVGMLELAASKWSFDKPKSFLIGDKSSDIECAKNFSIRGHLFKDGNLLDFIKLSENI